MLSVNQRNVTCDYTRRLEQLFIPI